MHPLDQVHENELSSNEAIHLPAHVAHLMEVWGQALAAGGYDGAWIAAGESHLYFQDDHGPAFKATPYFSQWVDPKYAQSGAHLLLRPEAAQPLILFTPQPDDYWHAVADTPHYLAQHMDLRGFADVTEMQAAARLETQGSKRMAYIGEQPSNAWGGEPNPASVLAHLDYYRAVKTTYELEIMRTASLIGALGHQAAAECFKAGGSEFEIHMAYLGASRQNEHQLPYGNIVAVNEHAAILHYQHQERMHRDPPQSLLIDAGGQHRGFASDITRTYAAVGNEHADFVSLLAAMENHQARIIQHIKPGLTFADLHEFMHRSLCDVLVHESLIECSAEDAFEQRLNESFCPHGLGHLLGVQVHDVGGHIADALGTPAPPSQRYPTLRFTREIECDQVFTIEPGLYFIDSLLAQLRSQNAPINWQKVDQLKGYGGIRIEDNVRVLPQGVENLTRDAFAKLGAHT